MIAQQAKPEAAPAEQSTVPRRTHRHELPTGVLGLDCTPDGALVYAACVDGVYRLDAATGAHELLYRHGSYASGLSLLPGEKILVSGGYDGVLKWWDIEAGREARSEQAHDFWSWGLATSPDGRLLASVTGQYLAGGYRYEPAPGDSPSVRLYDAAGGKLIHSFEQTPPVQAAAIDSGSRYLAAGNLMGEVRVWDTESGREAARWTTEAFTGWGIIKSHCFIGGIHAMEFLPDGELLLAGMGPMRDPMAGNGKQLWQRWSWREGQPRLSAEIRKEDAGEGLMEALAASPRGDNFTMAGRLRGGNWNVARFKTADGALIDSFKTDSRVTGLRYAAGGSRLVLCGARNQPPIKDGKIAPWGHVDIYDLV